VRPDQIDDEISAAYIVAENFLKTRSSTNSSESPGSLPPRENLGAHTQTWYWDDETPLFEIALFDNEGQSGSIVVNTSRSLPPVAMYRTIGPSFAEEVTAFLHEAGYLETFEVQARYLFSPLEPVLKVRHRKTGATGFLALPTLREYMLPAERAELRPIIRPKFSHSLVRTTDKAWDLLERGSGSRTMIIQSVISPIKYQQGCDSYPADIVGGNSSANYCTPRGIAGCVPVAWAMMASSMKKAYEPRIWAGVTGWDTPWPSCGGGCNPSQCDAVNQTIWGVHGHIGTTHDGDTSTDHSGEGGNYLTTEFKLPTVPGGWPGWIVQSPDMNKIRDLIATRLRPVYYGAQGQWPHTLKQLAGDLGLNGHFSTGDGVIDGHAVVAYGCDMDGYMLFVCFGWGSGFSDSWIDIGWYQDAQIIFNAQWG
jgi:hypothetical protein